MEDETSFWLERKLEKYSAAQAMFLFHDTALANVTPGDSSLGRAEAEQALRQSGAWKFVGNLPKGMDTVLGERGTRLSGGQRQRIAIARALARKPKLPVPG